MIDEEIIDEEIIDEEIIDEEIIDGTFVVLVTTPPYGHIPSKTGTGSPKLLLGFLLVLDTIWQSQITRTDALAESSIF